jgi:Fe-S-cluster containining protein
VKIPPNPPLEKGDFLSPPFSKGGQGGIFLTAPETITAICLDLRLYPPQNRLFRDLSPLILGPESAVSADTGGDGFWISEGRRMRRISAGDLRERLVRTMEAQPPPLPQLAGICGRVFRTSAKVGQNDDGEAGIWIDTGMDAYRCRQCGDCCRRLDYRHQITAEDVQRWRQLGRTDILEWVREDRGADGEPVYSIWREPGTARYADVCPWLKNLPGTAKWICAIHDVKPEICRQYPATRKHAEMTGCAGFG